MKRIAVPITRNNKIEDYFGRCKFYEIYTFSNTNEIVDVQLLESGQGLGCKSNIVSVLANRGVTFMLSGNIGDKTMNKLNGAGISVIRGCSGDSSDAILQFIEGGIFDSGISCLQPDKNHRDRHV